MVVNNSAGSGAGAGRTPGRRLRTALAGAAVGVVGLTGSVVVLGQAAGADSSPVLHQAETTHNEPLPAEDWAEFDQCLIDQGVMTEEELAESYAFEDDPDATIDETFPPSVYVEFGDRGSFIELGDGDSTVTITKVDDDISIATTGDVVEETIDYDELEAQADAEIARWDEAMELCEELAPDDGIEFEDHHDFEEGDVQEEASH